MASETNVRFWEMLPAPYSASHVWFWFEKQLIQFFREQNGIDWEIESEISIFKGLLSK